MVLKAGIPLLDLFGLSGSSASDMAATIYEFLNRFSVSDHRTRQAAGVFIHHGKLQSLADTLGSDSGADGFDIGIGTLQLPLVHGGLPFTLSLIRSPVSGAAGGGETPLEPTAAEWQLSIALSDFVLALNGLQPAIHVPANGTSPRHLIRDPQGGAVRIIGSATLRLTKFASGGVSVSFADDADPFDPTVVSGGVANLVFSPPHFFFGDSETGMTVGPLLFDFSDQYSPEEVLNALQGPEWVGMLIKEATVYAPRNLPIVGDLSAGVRNVLIGNPLGIQGSVELEFGRSPLDPATFRFLQELEGPGLEVSGTGEARLIRLQGSQDQTLSLHGFLNVGPTDEGGSWFARWSFDDGPLLEGLHASYGVRHGSVVKVTPVEVTSEGVNVSHPDVTFRVVVEGTGPDINVSLSTANFSGVIHLSGTVTDLNQAQLIADSNASGDSTFRWILPAADLEHEGQQVQLDVTGLEGEHDLKLIESNNDDTRVSHLKIKIISSGPLYLGTQQGVFAASDSTLALDLSAVEATFDLSDYHAVALTRAKPEQATLDGSLPEKVLVPDDSIAQVTITEPGAVAPGPYDHHIQVLMEFERDEVIGWGELKPQGVTAASDQGNLQTQLLYWANQYPGAKFLVIGRCDDIWEPRPGQADTLNDGRVDSFNRRLAVRRAEKAKSLLTLLTAGAQGEVITADRIFIRGETSDWQAESSMANALQRDALIPTPLLPDALKPEESSVAVGNRDLALGWLIKHIYEDIHTSWRNQVNTDAEDIRRSFRRVDIFAVGGTPADTARRGTGDVVREPSLRRSWVAAGNREPVPVTPSTGGIDYRVRLEAGWNSPVVASWKDAVPSLLAAEFAWTPAADPLPDFEGAAVPVQTPSEVLTVFAKWVHDSQTEFTRVALGIRSDGDPNGLLHTDQRQLTAAAALGPVLLSGVDFDEDMIGSTARLTALGAGVGLAGQLLQDGSSLTLVSIEAEAQTRALSDPGADYQISLKAEYTTTLHIDVDLGIIRLSTASDAPMKIRYKKVGIEFDNSKSGWEQVGFGYDTDALEIEDAGRWRVNGVLGQLLRIVEISMGRGSLWLELRIAVALDLGVIEVSEILLRVIFEDDNPAPRFELRGFVLKADVPNVLQGEGRVRIEDGGVIRAGVDANIIPLGAGANAAIAFSKITDPKEYIFLSIFLGVQFNTPIPLAQSGAALYGFKGLFTMNGSRKLPSITDPISRELAWWNTPPENKYEPDHGQFAIGVGVVVGTMPDVSFCFSAAGMVVVAFPDPEVILGVDVNIISVPDKTAKDKRPNEGNITGLIVIDDTAVLVAVSAQYTIPELLEIKIPFGAYFPYSGNGVYVRLGADGNDGRVGEPVTLRLLPSTLNVNAWAYLMIEQNGLPNLGGDARFSFDGFSVGFGAGWGIEWSAGPIRLSATAKVLVGFGTNPLIIKGGVFFSGELSLVVVSLSASAELILTYINEGVHVEGKVCGEVDLFFFSIKGCVGVSFGNALDADEKPPAPESPVASVSLIDRQDRIMGSAVPEGVSLHAKPLFDIDEDGNNKGASTDENHTVWPDTAPVVHFKHYVKNATAGQFAIADTPTQPLWFGGNLLKYTYRIDDMRLVRKSDGVAVASERGSALQSVWMTSPYKLPGSAGSNGNPLPSEHEGPNLKLLDWNPWNWVVNTESGGEGVAGDPAADVGSLCGVIEHPRRACVFGSAAVGASWNSVVIRFSEPSPPPYPSRFVVTGMPTLGFGSQRITGRELQMFVNQQGGVIRPGLVELLRFPHTQNSEVVTHGYRLPRAEITRTDDILYIPLPWEVSFDRAVVRPSIRVMVCALKQEKPETQCVEFENLKTTGQHVVFKTQGFVFRALSQDSPIELTDIVTTASYPDMPGSDGVAEIIVPLKGLSIDLNQNCSQIELWFLSVRKMSLNITAYGVTGEILQSVTAYGSANKPVKSVVMNASGIKRIVIEGSNGIEVLYRICCGQLNGPITPHEDKACDFFEALKPGSFVGQKLQYRNVIFEAVAQEGVIRVRDDVNARAYPPTRGSDNRGDILIPSKGMIITLAQPSNTVDLGVMLFNAKSVTAIAYDAVGNEVSRHTTPEETHIAYSIALNGDSAGITSVRLEGGDGEAVLYQLCVNSNVNDVISAPNSDLMSSMRPTPNTTHTDRIQGLKVKGIRNNALVDSWAGKVIESRSGPNGLCQVIEYAPVSGTVDYWHGLQMVSPADVSVSVIAICGIDRSAQEARNDDEAQRRNRLNELGDVLDTPVNERREILLQPGEEYEIQIDWSWQYWRSNSDGTNSPPSAAELDSSRWEPGDTSVHQFAVADIAALTDVTQDGLNEYVFDVRDVARYVNAIEPVNGRSVHFTDDPVWVHFDSGHVKDLVALYHRSLEIVVRRTDPPPQSSTMALQGLLEPLLGTLNWFQGPLHLEPVGYQRIAEQLEETPCLPAANPGGASLEGMFNLEPGAMYDLELRAVSTNARADSILVLGTRFMTSRYANPRAMLEDMGYGETEAMSYVPEDLIMPEGAVLPEGPLETSDTLMDEFLEAIGAATLPLPSNRSETYVIWRQHSSGWHVEGILIDALESLNREITQRTSTGTEMASRCVLTSAMLTHQRLRPIRANANWTRVLLRPDAPIVISDINAELELTFTTQGAPLSGRRAMGYQPAMILREGF